MLPTHRVQQPRPGRALAASRETEWLSKQASPAVQGRVTRPPSGGYLNLEELSGRLHARLVIAGGTSSFMAPCPRCDGRMRAWSRRPGAMWPWSGPGWRCFDCGRGGDLQSLMVQVLRSEGRDAA